MKNFRLTFILFSLVLASLLSLGCTGTEDTETNTPATDDTQAAASLAEMQVSVKSDLRWVRARVFETRLGQALLLDESALCEELGIYSCVNDVHLVALGGNDPYEKALYEPMASPSATTPIAVERLVVSACVAAVEKEKGAAQQFVFLDLDLNAESLDVLNPVENQAISDTIVSLYRRFHSRNPLPQEEVLARELLVDGDGNPVSASAFAQAACIAIGSTSEAVFY